MKKHEFQTLVDQSLSDLVWDEHQRQRVLHAVREEEKPMKKISFSLIMVVLILCISMTALAAGLLFSPRYDVAKMANAAMEEQYGITPDLLSLFHRTVAVHADGSATVTYAAPLADFPAEQMGDYFVEVTGNHAQAFWSNDGMDTSGGLDAKAWGREQLQLLSYDYANTMQYLWDQNATVSPVPTPSVVSPEHRIWTAEDEAEAQSALDLAERANQQRLAEIAKAESTGNLTVSEAAALAHEAVCQEYKLTEAQRSKLIGEPDSTYITYEDEQPLAHLLFWLWQQDEGPFTEKDGQYWVTIDLITGMIEDILYDAGLAGNG